MSLVVPPLLLLILILMGLPIAFALTVSGVVGIWIMSGDVAVATSLLGLVPESEATSFVLVALPLFMLMAYLAGETKLADDVYNAATAWLGGVRGGLSFATIMAGGAMGALSGSTIASASALSGIAVRNQVRAGYSRELATGSAALAATLAVLIPPSIFMIIYGVQTETSVGDLLIAGLIPGIVLMVLLAATIKIWVTLAPDSAPAPIRTSMGDRMRLTARVLPAIGIVVAVFAALYSGALTATEVAGLGALATLLVAGVMRRVTLMRIWRAALDSVKATSMIVMIIIGGTIFARYLALTGLPQDAASLISDANLNRWLVIGLIFAGYFVLSMFMEEIALVILILPVVFPTVLELGFDPVWFGVMLALMVITGLVFPPVGVIAFVVSGATGVESTVVFKGAIVLLVPVFVSAGLLMVFPGMATYLPNMR